MQIRTKSIFFDENTKKDIECGFIFDLFDVCDANEIDDGYTCITIASTAVRTNIKIKFDTYWKLIESKHISYKRIIE